MNFLLVLFDVTVIRFELGDKFLDIDLYRHIADIVDRRNVFRSDVILFIGTIFSFILFDITVHCHHLSQ